MTTRVVGLVLAAGAGMRMGSSLGAAGGAPKALVTDELGGTWLARSVAALRDGGVETVYVVLGADVAAVRPSVPTGCIVVEAADWAEGMGASLRAGLGAVALGQPAADAVVVSLVDTPDVGAAVVRRLVASVEASTLARAGYDGHPGHPVVLGRAHWRGVLEVARGDAGARQYLARQQVAVHECGDLATGADIDVASQLGRWRPPV